MTELAIVLGTRPEIVKLAPLIRACQRRDVDHAVVHTGQHYSNNLDAVFFDQLELPEPEYNLGIESGSHGQQTGEMVIALEAALQETSPDAVVVQGDTNSCLAGAIAASKLDVTLAHVEAGLRSFDRSMPEEMNRIVADNVADVLFPPTAQSESYLLREGISQHRITVTGNTVVDALERHRAIAREKSTVVDDLGLDDDFFLMTAHRAENVDDETRFRQLLSGVGRAAIEHDRDVIYPVHPRARDRLETFAIDLPDRVRPVEPQSYLDFLRLEAAAEVILTDSGGVQEEACILGVPCVTMRENTERPETLDAGANRLSSCEPKRIVRSVSEAIDGAGGWENPFGDGDAAERILANLPVKSETPEPTDA